MPSLSLTVRYNKNSGMVLSASELMSIYMYGSKVQDRSGQVFQTSAIEFYVKSAQMEIEKYLGIKILKEVIEEKVDFYQDEYRSWNYLTVTYPCNEAFELTGHLANVKQVQYPREWLSSRRTNDGYTFFRRIFTVPAQTTQPLAVGGQTLLFHGILPYTNMLGYQTIPNYWNVVYVTGYDKLPFDLLELVGKIAAIGVMAVGGDIGLGMPGLASYSLGIDGLSQSISTTNSATSALFGARIKQYEGEIKEKIKRLRSYYKGVVCSSI